MNVCILILLILHFTTSLSSINKNLPSSKNSQEQILEKAYNFIPPYVDFDIAINKTNPLFNRIIFHQKKPLLKLMLPIIPSELYKLTKNLYKENFHYLYKPDKEPRIPKIIHQIWLGSPLPERYKKFISNWRKHHPDWEYILWTDKSIKTLNLQRPELVTEGVTYADITDILRYEILYQFGGLYIDTDYECLQPFDILHHCYDFYACLHPLELGKFLVNTGLIASKPGHPILKHLIPKVQSPKTLEKYAQENNLWVGTMVTAAAGTFPFTKAIYAKAGKEGSRDIIFPTTFMHACYKELKTISNRMEYNFKDLPFKAPPEAFALHYWETSWIGKKVTQYNPTDYDALK